MSLSSKFETEDVSPYRVQSHREIVGLLRALQERGQLVSMQAGGADAVLTSVLEVDEPGNMVVIDRASGNALNQRVLASENIAFETLLDSIRIMFFSEQVKECLYDGSPALYIPIPTMLVRLQRREHYRVPTPVTNPLRCSIQLPAEKEGGLGTTVVLTVKDISCGGIALIDEKKQLDNTIGRIYPHCRIDFPGGAHLTVQLQVRNSSDQTLANGRAIRKIGCMYVDPSQGASALVQRYITKLERERNARATGMA